MFAETGHYALVLSLFFAFGATTTGLWGARTGDMALMRTAGPVSMVIFGLLGISFGCLTAAYLGSDFSVQNVYENSHSLKPLIYKITGVWGNHEGSMLLWVLILGLFGALVAVFGRGLPDRLRSNVLGVQGSISFAFILFILMTSNPFARLVPAPVEGNDLNPLLQDIGLAAHPPLLYLGYVGCSISFSFAVAALIEGRLDSAWARWVRPWTLTAWIFLTAGISMGSYWAYYELGWGGWWFWDPVENASLMPWLSATALLHSAIVMEKREALKIWTIFLAILTFSLSLAGTFIVRSGVLTSVHAFATDPARGIFILGILIFFTGGALALFAWRAERLKPGGLFAPVSREGALVFNNLFLSAACAVVFVGTLYPLVLESINVEWKISVGPPFFNMTFGPLMIPLLMAMPLGPFLAWKRGDITGILQRFRFVFAASVLTGAIFYALNQGAGGLAPLAVALAVWVIVGSLWDPVSKSKLGTVSLATAWARLSGLPRAVWGATLSHAGIGIMLLGIVGVSAYSHEDIVVMKPGTTHELAGYTFIYDGARNYSGPNYIGTKADIRALYDGRQVASLHPSKRRYDAREMTTTEAAIHTVWPGQLYVSMGDQRGTDGFVIRLYYKRLVTLIWIGTLFMIAGGFLSLSDRRLRMGVPKAARAPVPAGVPAE